MSEEYKNNSANGGTVQKLTRLLAAPVIEPSQRAARIQTVERDIVLPLRLLIIAILGYYFFLSGWLNPPVEQRSTFSTGDVADLPAFAADLSAKSNPVSEFLRLQFGEPLNSRLQAYNSTKSNGRELQRLLVSKLNRVIAGSALSGNVVFQNVQLRPETVELRKKNPEGPQLQKLNRLILEDAYPSELSRGRFDPINDWSMHHGWILKAAFVAYVLLNVAFGAVLIRARHLTLTKVEWMVFAAGALDCFVMGMLTFLSKGFDSALYWVFVALILHTALAIPVAFPQLLLNFLTIGSFVTGGYLDARINVPDTIMDVENISQEKPFERVIVLVAWALCCYGIQVLFEKQKRAEAEATEFAVRQERLRTAGRLAAEIAHQIKNPLGIITNAAFCLQRSVREGEMAVDDQIEIIREEVDRADQIITELMGYAQLAEGKVERLVVAEELDSALQEVFPAAAKYKVAITKDYDPALPALLMQKRHLGGVFVNLLQNAREAMNGRGQIEVTAKYGENDSIQIQIVDSGPGIAPDKIDKIFEAYFTTREKGTGLGLAIVKHNTEMYGGTVNVYSEIGKGTRFALEFPARILMRLSR